MILGLRVVGRELSGSRDLVVRLEQHCTVADLCVALADHLDVPVPGLISQRGGHVLPTALPVSACGLVTGELVMIGTHADVLVDIGVDVGGGTSAGSSLVISAGRWLIGRGAAADVSLADPSVSRRHAEVEVTAQQVTLSPIGNVLVNGRPIVAATAVDACDVVSIGSIELRVRRPAARPFTPQRASRNGTIEFRRTPYRRPIVSDRGTVTIGPIPERHQPRRMQLLSIAGPLLAGLMLFAFMRRVEFLALTLLSPVLLLATSLDDRRSGRRSRRREITAFRSMLDDRRQELAGMRDAERSERLATAPELADLVRRAEQTALDLWPRGPDAEDFLRLRVGTGTQATRFGIALAPGGEQRLRDDAAAAFAGATAVDGVPVTVDLAAEVVAIHGDAAAVNGVLTSLLVQAACLHAPGDLVIAAAIAPDRGCDWIKWLPHARGRTIPTIAHSPIAAAALVHALPHVARQRAIASHEHEPRLLVIVDGQLVADASAIVPLLTLEPSARISVLWLAGSAADVPRHAQRVLEVGPSSRLWSTTPGLDPVEVQIELAPRDLAQRVALALAPVRDVAAGESAGLSVDVTLLDVLGCGATSSATLARWWQRPSGFELRFPIGVAPNGPVEIDLVEDGPHVLIAGTTGSGKSELLQSAVTALAARYSPQQVNFLFVDYKGGAATKVFEHLPHTVGYVSNLDGSLARRAMASLRAELERRMALLEGRVKDLRELVAVAPDQAPPALVIVIDEFATLAKQLPDFVAGVIDVAQRGRSLGVHLVISTQRLSGAVDDNIVANANVRIALRVLDRSDSTAMIGSAAAAEIGATSRGRGVVRIGSQRPLAFQSAYGGRRVGGSVQSPAIAIADFDEASQLVDASPPGHDEAIAGGMTQQAAVLAAVAATDRMLTVARPRRPWHEPLAPVVRLDELGQSGPVPAIGLFDAPALQQQGALRVDLERGGGCLIYGSGGSGKTTALRSMALALCSLSGDAEPVAILAFDCASGGLSMLRPLGGVVDVATSDDIEALSRHIVMLDRELTRRRQLLSQACAEHLSAYNAANPVLPRIVVLIDDIGALVELIGGQGNGALAPGEPWPERLVRVLVEGRRAGIHGVVTADRRTAVPARLHAAVSNRIVLAHADRLSYADHGVPSDASELQDLTPGRGWWNGSTVIQIAVASSDHSARGQREAIERAAAASNPKLIGVLHSTPLPRRVTVASPSPHTAPLTAPLGIEDVTCDEVTLDLSASHLAVIGGPRSGKSTALRTIAAGLVGGHELYAVGAADSGLAGAAVEHAAFRSANEIASLLDALALAPRTGHTSMSRPRVLLVDDLELLDDLALAAAWERVATCPQLRIVAAVDTTAITGFTSNPVAAALKRARRMLLLQPDDPGEFLQVTGVRLSTRPGTRWVPGRGVLVVDRLPRVVQVAVCDDGGRTSVRSRGTVAAVTVMSTQSLRTAAAARPARR